MSHMLRLEPPMWVEVVDGHTPHGLALAHIVFDYGAEANLVWFVVMNDPPTAGQGWCVENPNIRFCRNMTLGRPDAVKPSPKSPSNGPQATSRLKGNNQGEG